MHLSLESRFCILQRPSELTPDESIRLWELAKLGDRDSLAQLLHEVQDLIFRFTWSQLGNEELATEATQETATRFIQNIDSFRGQGKLSTWILGIANNVCREFRRKNSKWNQTAEEVFNQVPGENSLPLSELVSIETKCELTDAINQLPERQREAIVLRYFESLSVAEVAQVMKVSEGTVKATVSSAIKNLKPKLSNDRG